MNIFNYPRNLVQQKFQKGVMKGTNANSQANNDQYSCDQNSHASSGQQDANCHQSKGAGCGQGSSSGNGDSGLGYYPVPGLHFRNLQKSSCQTQDNGHKQGGRMSHPCGEKPSTPTPTPTPTPTYPKVQGSLNISGDPDIRVTTPGVTVNPISFTGPVGVSQNLLSDPDNGFNMAVQLHQVNEAGNVGIQDVTFSVNNHQVQFANNGDLVIDGAVQGNIGDAGFINEIDLGNGNFIKTALAEDGGGTQTERFVLDTPEYEVTAAKRQPTNTLPYYDVNIAERTNNAADNATGVDLLGQGATGIDDLLRQEPL